MKKQLLITLCILLCLVSLSLESMTSEELNTSLINLKEKFQHHIDYGRLKVLHDIIKKTQDVEKNPQSASAHYERMLLYFEIIDTDNRAPSGNLFTAKYKWDVSASIRSKNPQTLVAMKQMAKQDAQWLLKNKDAIPETSIDRYATKRNGVIKDAETINSELPD